MMKTSFIRLGRMVSILVKGFLKSGLLQQEDVIASTGDPEKMRYFCKLSRVLRSSLIMLFVFAALNEFFSVSNTLDV